VKYYVLIIGSGVDAESVGPFPIASSRDSKAREMFRSADFNPDYDSIFRMDIEHDRPATYAFGFGELDESAEPVASRN